MGNLNVLNVKNLKHSPTFLLMALVSVRKALRVVIGAILVLIVVGNKLNEKTISNYKPLNSNCL